MKFSKDKKEHDNVKVCVIGLGTVGLPTAQYCLDRGLKVYGYDIDPNAVNKAKTFGIFANTRWNEIPSVDAYIICVSTILRGESPDLLPIFDVCEKIANKDHSSPLVSIESTIIPGTSRKIYNEIFKRNVKLVHVPHRYWAGDSVKHGVKQLRVIGAICDESLEAGLKFYQDVLKIPLHIVKSIEVAEMSKITENACRYVQIAFAEELKMICGELGLDFEEVRKACNTKWNIEILEARGGIDGHCLPKDVRYLMSLSDANVLLASAVRADEEYRKWLARQVKRKKRTKPKILISNRKDCWV